MIDSSLDQVAGPKNASAEQAVPLRAGPRDRRVRRGWIALRVLVTLHALLIWVQPVLAGGYLSGDYDLLAQHARNADLVTYLGYAQLVAAVTVWALGGPRWPTLAALLVVAGETMQYFAGLAGDLAVHLPLGVALVAGLILLATLAWRRAPMARPKRPHHPAKKAS